MDKSDMNKKEYSFHKNLKLFENRVVSLKETLFEMIEKNIYQKKRKTFSLNDLQKYPRLFIL